MTANPRKTNAKIKRDLNSNDEEASCSNEAASCSNYRRRAETKQKTGKLTQDALEALEKENENNNATINKAVQKAMVMMNKTNMDLQTCLTEVRTFESSNENKTKQRDLVIEELDAKSQSVSGKLKKLMEFVVTQSEVKYMEAKAMFLQECAFEISEVKEAIKDAAPFKPVKTKQAAATCSSVGSARD